MREKFAGKVVNSILEDFPGYAIQVQDLPGNIVDSYSLLTTPMEGYQVELLNNTFAQFGYYDAATGLASLVEATETEGFTGEVTNAVAALNDNNNVYSAESILTGISRDPDGGLDPRPTAATDATYTTVPEGVNQVDYRGAFEPGQPIWLSGWSTLSQLGYLAE